MQVSGPACIHKCYLTHTLARTHCKYLIKACVQFFSLFLPLEFSLLLVYAVMSGVDLHVCVYASVHVKYPDIE